MLPADVVSLPGDDILRSAEVVSLPGNVLSLAKIRVSWLTERWLVPRQAERVFREMRRVLTAARAATAAGEAGLGREDSVAGFRGRGFGDAMEISARRDLASGNVFC